MKGVGKALVRCGTLQGGTGKKNDAGRISKVFDHHGGDYPKGGNRISFSQWERKGKGSARCRELSELLWKKTTKKKNDA